MRSSHWSQSVNSVTLVLRPTILYSIMSKSTTIRWGVRGGHHTPYNTRGQKRQCNTCMDVSSNWWENVKVLGDYKYKRLWIMTPPRTSVKNTSLFNYNKRAVSLINTTNLNQVLLPKHLLVLSTYQLHRDSVSKAKQFTELQ